MDPLARGDGCFLCRWSCFKSAWNKQVALQSLNSLAPIKHSPSGGTCFETSACRSREKTLVFEELPFLRPSGTQPFTRVHARLSYYSSSGLFFIRLPITLQHYDLIANTLINRTFYHDLRPSLEGFTIAPDLAPEDAIMHREKFHKQSLGPLCNEIKQVGRYVWFELYGR